MEFLTNTEKWIKENKQYFLPPVCNKLMHNKQLKVMFVGGPNQRKDYHIEEGEELFYQVEGDMCLKIIENGIHKDIHIKEGEMFLLPARIPHSPQRYANTVGLVFERRRLATEKDGLRFYVDNSTEVLYDRWFYCEDLGTQLVPIIQEFFNSKQYKTGKPDPDQPLEKAPFSLNSMEVMKPFSFKNWLEANNKEINQKKGLSLFEDCYETKAAVYGPGENEKHKTNADTWIWQLEGMSIVTIGDKTMQLNTGDSLLIHEQYQYTWSRPNGCVALCVCQDPDLKKPYI
ncbi:3-hydroxyanthranilate 3,4-dioxygenase [Bombina bombina]|uniref:3-hydroxyanthranilate 3,4-dioxygenase n=1 Tax=Bombina bombina TaxID=8345 RepID=UPI00235B0469|nr:3-hydroxyanthranilate 3,4-dioxygenase [Bombina bombina]